MAKLARLNLHLPQDVLTINSHYVSQLVMKGLSEELLAYCQVTFKPELWSERQQFPDQGYLLEKLVHDGMIEAISLLDREGNLHYYHFPYNKGKKTQHANINADGSLVMTMGDSL